MLAIPTLFQSHTWMNQNKQCRLLYCVQICCNSPLAVSKERRRGAFEPHNRPRPLDRLPCALFCSLAFVGLQVRYCGAPSVFHSCRRSWFIFTVLQGGVERRGTLVSHGCLCACGGKVLSVAQDGRVICFFVPMDLTHPFCYLLSFSHHFISHLRNGLRGLQGKILLSYWPCFSHWDCFIS